MLAASCTELVFDAFSVYYSVLGASTRTSVDYIAKLKRLTLFGVCLHIYEHVGTGGRGGEGRGGGGGETAVHAATESDRREEEGGEENVRDGMGEEGLVRTTMGREAHRLP